MFFDARRTKRLAVAPDGNDQLVPTHIEQASFLLQLCAPFAFRICSLSLSISSIDTVLISGQCKPLPRVFNRLFDCKRLVRKINSIRPGLEEVDVCATRADRFKGGAELEGADRGGG